MYMHMYMYMYLHMHYMFLGLLAMHEIDKFGCRYYTRDKMDTTSSAQWDLFNPCTEP